uniref:APC membrane recruitment protein 1 n=1 Tax=Leptobrachium leishanense TaxID=445787 RepID=A0A8C5W9F8_9ANUR
METGRASKEETTGTKMSSAVCERDCIRYDADTEKVETSLSHSGILVEQQTSGKQKKSPFNFFGGRKGICTLPSFFGGKHKGLGKGHSRKGLSKSRTLDGLSDAQGEDCKKESSIHRLLAPDHAKFTNTLPSSQSADSGITSPIKLDFNFHDSSPLGSNECFDKKVNGEKSMSLPRPKKGLKGLFSSIRRHKKNKTVDSEKSEQPNRFVPTVILEQASNKCLNEEDGKEQQERACVDVVSPENSLGAVQEKGSTIECSVNVSGVPLPVDKALPLEAKSDMAVDQNTSSELQSNCVECSSPKEVFLDALSADHVARDSLTGGDQICLMLEEVSSLKSFDSFTGCGDIIADQDIDHLSDNTISLDRSREAAKRSSCLVTYQGGGEEMATPDEMEEEYLNQLLEDSDAEASAKANYDLKREKENDGNPTSFISLEASDFPLNVKDSFDRALVGNTEVLTPQSDQQESAPNSDEGYYDSTTPGPEDDSGEGFVHKERLPRDSYSGDALYEFYEPDDQLMSPEPGGESLYESKTPCSEIFDQFFGFGLPSDSRLTQKDEHKRGATETEEERLAMIQKQLLFWERQRGAALKEMEDSNPNLFCKEKQNVECKNRAAHIMGRNKSCLGTDLVLLQNLSKDTIGKGIHNMQIETQRWTGFHSKSQDCYSQHLEGNNLMQDAGFELNVDGLGAQDQDETRNSTSDRYSNFKMPPMHHVQNVFGSIYGTQNECDETAEFSQTLEHFSNGMLFSSISECLGRTGSSSSFHHNLDSLPTMVTFDVVDVGNEGECEEQVELSPDEEVDTSFEPFEQRYIQESLADCDEQLFQVDSQLPFQTYNWGVASLPRHLDHYKLKPFMPVPLSINRRSKSLDTKSMEHEPGGLHRSRTGLKSNDRLVPWDDRHNSYGDGYSLGGEAEWDSSNLPEQDIISAGNFDSYASVIASKTDFNRDSKNPMLQNQVTQHAKQVTKTLQQCNTRQSREGLSKTYPCFGENATKKLALVFPLEEKRVQDAHLTFHDPATSSMQAKTKPVGVTQAMPQQRKKTADSFSHSENYPDQSEPTKKGTIVQRAPDSDDWNNHYSECTS